MRNGNASEERTVSMTTRGMGAVHDDTQSNNAR